jgi:hypothetical protein
MILKLMPKYLTTSQDINKKIEMDRRKDYKPFKITILELWFRFEYFGFQNFINRLGISSKVVHRIIDEWKDNDECLIVESKMNYQ